ncbi:MAG: ABC transporter permease [Bacteroidales bacterium]|nr:ABC transporter permease [Candidatus Latescibacterota bacterium]
MSMMILKRIAWTIPLVICVSMIVFSMMHLTPGGPVGTLASNPKVSGDDLARIRENYGLDRSLPVQYLCWFRQVFLRFDLGRSQVTGRSVSMMIIERLPATLELMATAYILAILVGFAVGVLSAVYRGRLIDQIFSITSIAGMSVPVFWTGLMALFIFSLKLGIFPAGGRLSGGAGDTGGRLMHIILPALLLSMTYAASWGRYIRAGLLDAGRGDFIRTARAKGLGEWRIVFKHSMRNAILPAVSVMVMQLPTLFTGAVITETVFSWPGIGRLFYEGLQRQDNARVLGIVVISSMLIILFNLAGDLINMIIDPRVLKKGTSFRDRGGASGLTVDSASTMRGGK